MKAASECIATKLRTKHRVLWDIKADKKKRNDAKIPSLCNKSNLTLRNLRSYKVN